MQNWLNLKKVVRHLNERPTKGNFPNPSRIRLSYLAGFSKRYRQSLVFSCVHSPLLELITSEFNSMNIFLLLADYEGMNYFPFIAHKDVKEYTTYLSDKCRVPGLLNLKKRAKEDDELDPDEANIQLLSFGVFSDFPSVESESKDNSSACIPGDYVVTSKSIKKGSPLPNLNPRSVPIARLQAFKQRVLPMLTKGTLNRVLLYVPDLFDFEELRIILEKESLEVGYINEYSSDEESDRYRTLFYQGRIRILAITERYYFFKRRKIKGAVNFIFYGPPTFPWFTKELFDTRFRLTDKRFKPGYDDELLESSKHLTDEPAPKYNLVFLYFAIWEARTVAAITGRLDV